VSDRQPGISLEVSKDALTSVALAFLRSLGHAALLTKELARAPRQEKPRPQASLYQ
jgi:hypothetical protein